MPNYSSQQRLRGGRAAHQHSTINHTLSITKIPLLTFDNQTQVFDNQIWNRDAQISIETNFALVPTKNDNNQKFNPFRVTVVKN